MIDKFFDPFSRMAREAKKESNVSIYIGECGSRIDEIVNEIRNKKEDRQIISYIKNCSKTANSISKKIKNLTASEKQYNR